MCMFLFPNHNTQPLSHSNEFILFALLQDGTYLQKLISPNIDGSTKRTVQDLLDDFSTSTHQAGKPTCTAAGSSMAILALFFCSRHFFWFNALKMVEMEKKIVERRKKCAREKNIWKKSDCTEWWNAVCCAPLMVCRYILWWLRETRQ